MRKDKEWFLDFFNILCVIIVCLIMLYPFWQTITSSFMTESEFLTSKFKLFVKDPTLSAYKQIFIDGRIFGYLKITVLITIIGTAVSLFFTAFSAYGLSKPFRGSGVIMFLIVMTMFIHAGLIPDYLNFRSLGLINSFGVYIIPSMINTFYLIIMRTTFRDFPKELEESARIDGCNYLGIFFRIVLPLSKPILAAIGLFFAVNYWNTYMQSVFFITDDSLKTVQEYLQRIVSDSSDLDAVMAVESTEEGFSAETIRLANVVIVLFPIISIYPFLQKYFVKGLMLGSLKG